MELKNLDKLSQKLSMESGISIEEAREIMRYPLKIYRSEIEAYNICKVAIDAARMAE